MVELSSIWGLTVVLCGLGIYIVYSYLENRNEKNPEPDGGNAK